MARKPICPLPENLLQPQDKINSPKFEDIINWEGEHDLHTQIQMELEDFALVMDKRSVTEEATPTCNCAEKKDV